MTFLFTAEKQPIDDAGISRQNLPLKALARLCPEWMPENRNPQSRYLACGQLFGNIAWLDEILFLTTDDPAPSGKQQIAVIDSGFWPIAHESIHYLLVHHSFASLDRPEIFLEEAVRVLDPAGTILFICPYRRWFWTQKMRKLPVTSPDHSLLMKSEIIKMIAGSGLDIVQVRHSRYLPAGSRAGTSKLSRFVGTGRYGQNSLLLVQARKRLYAPLKANYAYSRRRFSLGKMVPAGLAAHGYKKIGKYQ